MDVLRFIAWWWKKKHLQEKWLIAFFGWLSLMVPNMFLIGLKAILVFLGGIGIVAFGFLIYTLSAGLRKLWAEYQMEREAEAQLMIHKLKGTDIDSDGNELTSEEILRRLKMRANLRRIRKTT